MWHWVQDHWLLGFGTGASIAVAQTNLPIQIDGVERVSALGLLGVFMWFTLKEMKTAIKENSIAIKDNSTALQKLIDHLDNKR